MNKKLNIFAYAISIAGIVAQLLVLVSFSDEARPVFIFTGSLLNTAELMFFRFEDLMYFNHKTGLYINYLSLAAYCLLFVGAILWSLSKGRETRLVRTILGVILFEQGLFLISTIVYTIISFQQFLEVPAYWSVLRILSITQHALLFYFLYKAFKEYQQNRKLETEVVAEAEANTVVVNNNTPELVNARSIKRLSNLVIDSIFCFLILLPFGLSNKVLETLEDKFGERVAIFIFFVVARLIYYLFFESLIGATPGKLFTETRVVREYDDDRRSAFGVAVYRTLCRFIPFEPLSFLFTTSGGWHDSISNTRVVNEVRTGVRMRIYGLPFPIMIVIGILSFFAMEKYNDYKAYLRSKEIYDSEILNIKDHLSKLDTTLVIKFRNIDEPYSSTQTFLKIIEINGDDLTAYVIEAPDNLSTNSIKKIEDIYLRGKVSGFLTVVPIKRSDLSKAFTEDYDKSEENDRSTVDLFDDKRRFEIETIDRMFRPSIHNSVSGSLGGADNGISLTMLNYGWPAKIVSVENLEGTIEWYDFVGTETRTVRHWDSPSFSIMGQNYKRGEHYKVKMVLRDTLGRDYTYIIDGSDTDKTVELVE